MVSRQVSTGQQCGSPARLTRLREWAIIIPCYMMVLVLLTYFSYAGLSIYNTPDLPSPRLITGEIIGAYYQDPD